MELNRRLSRLEQAVGEAVGEAEAADAAALVAYENLSPEELVLWEETITLVRRVLGKPHDPDTVRLTLKGDVISLLASKWTSKWKSQSHLLRLRDACRRKLAEREG